MINMNVNESYLKLKRSVHEVTGKNAWKLHDALKAEYKTLVSSMTEKQGNSLFVVSMAIAQAVDGYKWKPDEVDVVMMKPGSKPKGAWNALDGYVVVAEFRSHGSTDDGDMIRRVTGTIKANTSGSPERAHKIHWWVNTGSDKVVIIFSIEDDM